MYATFTFMATQGPVFRAHRRLHTCNSPGRSGMLTDGHVEGDKSRVNTATFMKKRNTMSLKEKVKVIQQTEYGKKKAEVC